MGQRPKFSEDFFAGMTPKQREWFEMMGREEPLDDELAEYLTESEFVGQVLKHPLVFQVPYHEMMSAQSNLMLRQKKEAVADAIKNKKWHQVLWLYERPYRHYAFEMMAPNLTDEEYWDILKSLWTDTENPFQWLDYIEEFFEVDREGRAEGLMDDEEREVLASLYDPITVYRGYNEANRDGWSWTIDRDKAKWFARRLTHRGTPMVASGKVDKAHVIAYIDDRGEKEIVVNPEHVRIFRTTKYEPK